MKPIAAALAAVMLAGCAGTPPPPSKLREVPPEWMQPAPPLPDVPVCGGKRSERERVACRAEYEMQVRSQYVAVAGQKDGLADYIRASRGEQVTKR